MELSDALVFAKIILQVEFAHGLQTRLATPLRARRCRRPLHPAPQVYIPQRATGRRVIRRRENLSGDKFKGVATLATTRFTQSVLCIGCTRFRDRSRFPKHKSRPGLDPERLLLNPLMEGGCRSPSNRMGSPARDGAQW